MPASVWARALPTAYWAQLRHRHLQPTKYLTTSQVFWESLLLLAVLPCLTPQQLAHLLPCLNTSQVLQACLRQASHQEACLQEAAPHQASGDRHLEDHQEDHLQASEDHHLMGLDLVGLHLGADLDHQACLQDLLGDSHQGDLHQA